MPRFSVRGLLVATALLAVAIIPLLKPSDLWAYCLPAIASAIGVFAASKLMIHPKERAFWACFLVGVAAYVFTVAVVGRDESLGAKVWGTIHGDDFKTVFTFKGFDVWVDYLAAMASSVLFSLIAQVAAMRRNAQ